jgi:hypothetical protein
MFKPTLFTLVALLITTQAAPPRAVLERATGTLHLAPSPNVTAKASTQATKTQYIPTEEDIHEWLVEANVLNPRKDEDK